MSESNFEYDPNMCGNADWEDFEAYIDECNTQRGDDYLREYDYAYDECRTEDGSFSEYATYNYEDYSQEPSVDELPF